jgi:transcriptional regulator with XRE-family HTH domain
MTEMQAVGAIPEITLGWRLKMALDYAGVSVGEMADYLDVTRHTIGRWCNDHSPVRRSTLMLWSMRTGVSLEWLETGMVKAPQPKPEGLSYAMRDLNPQPADLRHFALTSANVVDLSAWRERRAS